ncbi:MAG: hypothetical protein COT13_05980 [Chloroflexi bacterium CG08_land_8_20_14_0_20_45_12]|nr:MAG: hypothetical protein AUK00_01580 [Dehalococcoidia bacterium CG2_30_46_9]PIU22903.1 MAG: hypothetical protein COT13_05980 [Chloroflexi bacterium CG08_land_8_20_14_0_20_45_12]PIX27501.1 MAG: hypothetical protein COZ67_02000 [Chloroflexi bacterium CG_4_8_14_3_um_filter_45_15]
MVSSDFNREDIEIAVLRAVIELGEKADIKEIYQRISSHLPKLSQQEVDKVVRWGKESLVQKDELRFNPLGSYDITDSGKLRVKQSSQT